MADDDTTEKVTIPSYGGNPAHIEVKNLQREEMEKLMACVLHGAYYAKGENGRITFIPAHEPLPDPITDNDMLPFWRKVANPPTEDSLPRHEDFVHAEDGYSPSITISGLCGYNYTPQSYQEYAKRLESYGFSVMRSKRGNDFKYWEHWYLSCLIFAKGGLAEAIKGKKGNDKEQLIVALEFIRQRVSFGSLDVSSQRLAMPNPE